MINETIGVGIGITNGVFQLIKTNLKYVLINFIFTFFSSQTVFIALYNGEVSGKITCYRKVA